jgi:hypothetical protein
MRNDAGPAPARGTFVSRAFVNEDAGGFAPRKGYGLPPRTDPGYDEAAARALLSAAIERETEAAETATGYYWGEPKLRPIVARIMEEATRAGDEELARAARRFL